MYDWPIDEIRAGLDRPGGRAGVRVSGPPGAVGRALTAFGFGPTLAAMMDEFYAAADGGTFYGGAFRVIPAQADPENDVPGLLDWNQPGGWKADAPPAARRTFVF